MHAFLRRHYKKGSASRKSASREKDERQDSVDAASPAGVLRYQDAVSKSMDSLLVVASSVTLPPQAQVNSDSVVSKRSRGRKRVRAGLEDDACVSQQHPGSSRQKPPPLEYRHSDNDMSSMERRHSYDFAMGKQDDESEDAEYDDMTDSLSQSADASPIHLAALAAAERRRRLMQQRSLSRDTWGSGNTDSPARKSRTSCEFTDSDDDRSFVSVMTSGGESQVYLISDGGDTELSEVLTSPSQGKGHVMTSFLTSEAAQRAKQVCFYLLIMSVVIRVGFC
jgi:hypothetical protein